LRNGHRILVNAPLCCSASRTAVPLAARADAAIPTVTVAIAAVAFTTTTLTIAATAFHTATATGTATTSGEAAATARPRATVLTAAIPPSLLLLAATLPLPATTLAYAAATLDIATTLIFVDHTRSELCLWLWRARN
jgi:hypothetical protein